MTSFQFLRLRTDLNRWNILLGIFGGGMTSLLASDNIRKTYSLANTKAKTQGLKKYSRKVQQLEELRTELVDRKQVNRPKAPVRIVDLKLAGVFYGGVSLTVYMYGQLMEIHNMLRAGYEFEKWCNKDDQFLNDIGFLDGTGPVYLKQLIEVYEKYGIEVRPTLDTIAGTSAGGILALSLGKSLSTNDSECKLEELRKTVLEEFDYYKLKWNPEKGWWGLLNTGAAKAGSFSFFKVLEWFVGKEEVKKLQTRGIKDHIFRSALKNKHLFSAEKREKMIGEAIRTLDVNTNRDTGKKQIYRNVPGLTVFTSVTSLDPFDKPLQISDPSTVLFPVVSEKYHNFIMTYKSSRNDFACEGDGKPVVNPLSFGIKTTSSFPVLFPGVRLSDHEKQQYYFDPNVMKVRGQFRNGLALEYHGAKVAMVASDKGLGGAAKKFNELQGKKEEFDTNYHVKKVESLKMKERELLDGGITNNKPFSPVLLRLNQRRQEYGFVTDRRLIVLEPDPEPGTIQISRQKEKVSNGTLLPTLEQFKAFTKGNAVVTTYINKMEEKLGEQMKDLADGTKKRRKVGQDGYVDEYKHDWMFKDTLSQVFGIFMSETVHDDFKQLREINRKRFQKLQERVKFMEGTSYVAKLIQEEAAKKNGTLHNEEKQNEDILNFVESVKGSMDKSDEDFFSNLKKKIADILVYDGAYQEFIGKAIVTEGEQESTPVQTYNVLLQSRYLRSRRKDLVESYLELLDGRDWLNIEKGTGSYSTLENLLELFSETIYPEKEIRLDNVEIRSGSKKLLASDFWFIKDMLNYAVRHLTNTSLWSQNLNKKCENPEAIEKVRNLCNMVGNLSQQLHDHVNHRCPINAMQQEHNDLEDYRKDLSARFDLIESFTDLKTEIMHSKLALYHMDEKERTDAEDEYDKLLKDIEEQVNELKQQFVTILEKLNEALVNAANYSVFEILRTMQPGTSTEDNSPELAAWEQFRMALVQAWLFDLQSHGTLSQPLGELDTIVTKKISPSNSSSLFRDLRQKIFSKGVQSAPVFLQSTGFLHADGLFWKSRRENDLIWGHIDGIDGMCTLIAEVVTKQLLIEYNNQPGLKGHNPTNVLKYKREPETKDKPHPSPSNGIEKYPHVYNDLSVETHIGEALRIVLNDDFLSLKHSPVNTADNDEPDSKEFFKELGAYLKKFPPGAPKQDIAE